MREVKAKSAVATKSDTDSILEEYKIKEKTLIYTTDNCPSMVKAFKDDQWYGCFLHVISLVQKHAFASDKLVIINRLFTKARRLVEFVNKSGKKKLFKPKLKQEVPTRFESFYRLINSIKENQETFDNLKESEKIIYYKKLNMSLLNYILKIVEVFEEARLRLGVINKSSFHLVYGIYHIFKATLTNLKIELNLDEDQTLEEDEREEIMMLLDLFLEEVDTCYLEKVSNKHKICSLLSPQFHTLILEEKDVVKELEFLFKSKVSNVEDSEEFDSVVTKKVDSFFNFIPIKKKKIIKKTNEFEQFLELEFAEEELNLDPIEFWNLNKVKFPTLSQLAIDLLVIPASSLFVESLFSKAGYTRGERRNLKPDTLEALLFCNSNSDLLDK